MSYQAKTDWRTSKNNIAPDFHWVGSDLTPDERRWLRDRVEREYPGARVVRDATKIYNCHAYAHAARHAWFDEIEAFLRDDYYPFTPGTLRRGDIVVYAKGGYLTHSGVITQLSGSSIVEVRSKWGQWPESLHAPENVPAEYGPITYYLRKRGTRTMDEGEPSDDVLDERVQDLLIGLGREERLARVKLASTPLAARLIVAELPEMGELLLHGARAARAIVDRLTVAEEEELAILAYAVEMLRYGDALPALAAKVAALPEDGADNVAESLLLSAFESLNAADAAGRRSRLTEAARGIQGGTAPRD